VPLSERPVWTQLRRLVRQQQARKTYGHHKVQRVIGALIMGNFVTACAQKQFDPTETLYPDLWYLIETVWNVIFIGELIWNAFAHWFRDFWCSAWNIFDVLVVGLSIPTMLRMDLGSFSRLRMLRAFRVFRLFKRVESLNKLLMALATSIPGMLNAGFVMFLVTCIYGMLGVDLFGKFADSGSIINLEGEKMHLETSRGLSYGEEYFGSLGRSLYTLLQVLTAESWSEAVARPAMFSKNGSFMAIYFVSYIMLNGIILTNVVVTVLLDRMLGPSDQPISEAEAEQMEKEATRLARFEYEVDSLEAECRMKLDQLTEVLLGIHGLVQNKGASRNNGRSIRRRHKLVDAGIAGEIATGVDAQASFPSRETSQDDLHLPPPLVEALPPRQVQSSQCFRTTTVAAGLTPKASSPMGNTRNTTPMSPEAVQLLPVVHVLAVTAAQVANGYEPGRAMPPPLVYPPASSPLEGSCSSRDSLEAEAIPMQSRWRSTVFNGVLPA